MRSSGRGRKTAFQNRAVNRKEVKPSGQEPRVLTTMRLRRSLRKDLEATAARTRRSVADVAQELLDEALRMRQCPGIYFADEPSGRTAKIGGTGLGVWEDRKSTRLNSSHRTISYAVFCLKKKTICGALLAA